MGRWKPYKTRSFAKELIGMKPDLIVPSSNLVTSIMQQETHIIPMVFINVGDPIGSGFVASMAQPGGNLTGFAVLETAIAGKWVELLNEVAPQVSRVGFILHRETPANVGLPPAGLRWRDYSRDLRSAKWGSDIILRSSNLASRSVAMGHSRPRARSFAGGQCPLGSESD